MAQNGLWKLARERMLHDRGALLKEQGDTVREYKAMHEENFPSSWLRKDVDGKEEGRHTADKETIGEGSRSGKKVKKERTKRFL